MFKTNNHIYLLHKLFHKEKTNQNRKYKTILFIHGYRDNFIESKAFLNIKEVFSKYNLIFLTFRNHLKDVLYQNPYPTIEERTQDLQLAIEEICQEYNLNPKELIVFAYSQGASVMLNYLAKRQSDEEEFEKILLVSPRIFLNKFISKRIDSEQKANLEKGKNVVLKDNVILSPEHFEELHQDKLKIEILNLKSEFIVFWGEKDDVVENDEIDYLDKLLKTKIFRFKEGDHLLRREYLEFIGKKIN